MNCSMSLRLWPRRWSRVRSLVWPWPCACLSHGYRGVWGRRRIDRQFLRKLVEEEVPRWVVRAQVHGYCRSAVRGLEGATIAAGFGVQCSVPRTGFNEPKTDSKTPHDSVKIAADSRFGIVPGSSIRWRTVRQKFPFPKSYLLQS
jgi:hypothetical protein